MATSGSTTLETIRAAILGGQWSPGDKLQPVRLAAVFGTSTTVVREALTRLAGDNLVTIERNRGFFVRELRLRELRDLTELRCTTEALAVRLAVERGGVQWEAELIAVHHQLARTPRRVGDGTGRINEAWTQAHRTFHAKLIEACDCEPMTKLASNLADSTELYRQWAAPSPAARVRDVEEEHRGLLAAALNRDSPQLGSLLRQHYEATVDVVLEAGLSLNAL